MVELAALRDAASRRGQHRGALDDWEPVLGVADGSGETGGRTRGAVGPALIVVLYLVFGLVAFWPVLANVPHRLPFQIYGDPSQMVWFIGWTAHAITTGHNPFFSEAANAPFGINMAQMTFAPLLGLLFLPLTLVAGPVTSTAVCFTLAMPISAASAFAVLRRWDIWMPASALGGLAYGFSPYMVDQGGTHLNLAFTPLPPLIIACVVRLLSRPPHSVRCGLGLGLLVAAQFFISSEVLAITAILTLLGIVIVCAYSAHQHQGRVRAVVSPALKGAIAATAVAALLVAYPVWYQFAGPRHYRGAPWPYQPGYNASLLEFVAPTPHQLIQPALSATGAGLYAGSFLEDGAYLGFGVLLVIAALVWACRHSPKVRLATTMGAISAVLSFGPYIYTNGVPRRVVLPFYYLTKLPAVADIVPIRFSLATGACVAALLAFGLDDLRWGAAHLRVPSWGPAPRAKLKLTLGAVLLIVGVTWLPSWPFPSQSVTTLPSAVTTALPPGRPIVLTYPYPLISQDTAMLWQAEAGFSFRLIGVYARVPQTNGAPGSQAPPLDPPEVQDFLSAEESSSGAGNIPAGLAMETRQFISAHHVGAIIVSLSAPRAAAVARTFSTAIGAPNLVSGGFEIWVTTR